MFLNPSSAIQSEWRSLNELAPNALLGNALVKQLTTVE